MKQLLLISIAIFSFMNSSVSQNAASMLLGGNLLFTNSRITQSSQDMRELYLSIGPVIGIVVNQNLTVGILTDFEYSKLEDKGSSSGSIYGTTISLAPFIRLQDSITGNLKYFFESYMLALQMGQYGDKIKTFNVGIGFGLLYFMSSKLSLELNIGGFSFIQVSNKTTGKESNKFSFDYDLVRPNLGIKYYL